MGKWLVLVVVVCAACGGEEGGGPGSLGDGGVQPPAPVCSDEGGDGAAAAPALLRGLSDRGREGWLGSPVVADLDGDGEIEVAAARGDSLVVWGAAGEVAWRA